MKIKVIITNQENQLFFWDKDGVIIKDCHYIKDPNQVTLLQGVNSLLKKSKIFGWKNIVITNQSGIERGYFNWKDYEKINDKMLSLLDLRQNIDAIYACGEMYESSKNSWRKPNPRMLFEAAADLNIDLDNSILIGDRLSDLKAGKQAGLKILIHVLTGYGKSERDKVKKFFNLDNVIRSDSYKNKFVINNNQILFFNDLREFDCTILNKLKI